MIYIIQTFQHINRRCFKSAQDETQSIYKIIKNKTMLKSLNFNDLCLFLAFIILIQIYIYFLKVHCIRKYINTTSNLLKQKKPKFSISF